MPWNFKSQFICLLFCFSHLYYIWLLELSVYFLFTKLLDWHFRCFVSIFNTSLYIYCLSAHEKRNTVHSLNKENIVIFKMYLYAIFWRPQRIFLFVPLFLLPTDFITDLVMKWKLGKALKEEMSGWLLVYQTAWSKTAVNSGLPLCSDVLAFNVLK